MDRIEGHLQLDVNQDEKEFGFVTTQEPSGVRAVVCELHPGLRAVKVRADDGSIEYAVCDKSLVPLYQSATTLDELRRRFPRSQ